MTAMYIGRQCTRLWLQYLNYKKNVTDIKFKTEVNLFEVYMTAMFLITVYFTTVFGTAVHLLVFYIAAVYLTIV